MGIQLVQPNTSVTDGAGWCLRFTQSVWGAPARYNSAWDAWNATEYKHYNREMPTESVIVWFSHYGSYGTPPSYANWGHVVSYISGRGFLSSPGSGVGQKWLATIEEVERVFNAKFVGWTEDINGLRVAKISAPQKLTEGNEMYLIKDANGSHFLVKPTGIDIVTDLYDVELLRLALTSDPNNMTVFAVEDVPRVNKYLKK